MYRYEINGKPYTQRKLVYGQVKQLLAVLQGVTITSFAPAQLFADLDGKLLPAVAVCLIPEGCGDIGGRDLQAIERDLDLADFEAVMEVVSDFFACNRISSLLGSLDKIMAGILGPQSSALSPSSPAETSASATP